MNQTRSDGCFPARNLAAIGFGCFAIASYYVSTHTTRGMSFGEASFLRVVQMLPIPFCFIAITNAAYFGLPKEASNQVSGLINFSGNVGGSIFISVTGAMVVNRGIFHQARLVDQMQYANPQFDTQAQSIGAYIARMHGGSQAGHSTCATRALANSWRDEQYNTLSNPSGTLIFGDERNWRG